MDRLRRLEEEVEKLKATVSELQNQVAALREAMETLRHPVETLLWQRGLPVMAQGDRSRTLLPPNASPAQTEHFYQLLRRYSFRLFLRDLIQFPEGADLKPPHPLLFARTVRGPISRNSPNWELLPMGTSRSYRLIPQQISSFGPTLEWYVSEILQREFMAPALFNVRLHRTRYGGDYDVITIVNGHLVYVEIKSSPPRGVELQAVSAFLNRLQDLQPHMAIFLVDTELRMKDKIVPLFAEALEAHANRAESGPISRLINEIFHIRHAIYLVNSSNGIYTNLRSCFRDFLQKGRKAGDMTLA